MNHLPTPPELAQGTLPESAEPILAGEGGQHRRFSWRAVLRNRWIILTCTGIVFAIGLGLTRLVVPLYEGASTLRIEEKEPNLPEVFRTLSGGSSLATEIEELRSRTLAAAVTNELGLRLALLEPRINPRSRLLQDVRVSDSARAGSYRLIQGESGQFSLLEDATGRQGAEFAIGKRVKFGGFSFLLTPAASAYSTIRFDIRSQMGVAQQVAAKIVVTQSSRDVNIVKVSYRSADRELAWRVPQALVNRYVTQRQELQKLETGSTIEYLHGQIQTIATQLAASERELEVYRKRFDVIDPQAEATSQVGRLVAMQTQRGMIENEQKAMAALLAEVDTKAVGHKPGDPSPYRRLLAFPTLLQSQAATGLLQSLSTAEDQRTALLIRRTPQDSDVRALDRQIKELEGELRLMAVTYLQGLADQVQSLDSGLKDFQQQLRSIPEKELQYARLERQPKVLEGIYTMLQTRLKEAEVAAAARDPGVRVVDAAIPPIRPVWPRPIVNAIAALVCGFLLGLVLAFAREYMDRAVRTRADVFGSTGLPVLGLIPEIKRKGSAVALIAERTTQRVDPGPGGSPPSRLPQRPQRRRYTFLNAENAEPFAGPEESFAAHEAGLKPAAEQVKLTIRAADAATAEAYGVLQTNIAFSRPDTQTKTLVVTSPLSRDGKTTTVVNLGLSLAQRGLRVLLIDADLRRGGMHALFGTAREPGVSEVLKGIHAFESVRRQVSVGERNRMDYLTTGKLHARDQGLVFSEAMRNLLARVREEYDVVVVDTPPVNIITDAALLGANADGVVLVARVGVTEATALSYAVEQLRHVRAPILGVILNDIDLRRDVAYDSTYSYFRDYEYSTSHS